MKNIQKKYELILCEVGSNKNKFWRGLLYDDGTGASEFGRVGYVAQVCEYPSHAIVETKMKQKLKKGYTELKTINAVTSASGSVVKNSDLHSIAKSQLTKSTNPVLERLIQRFVDANVHKITQNTQITYNSTTGLFMTPLGVVTIDGLTEARNLLAELAPMVRKHSFGAGADTLLSKYLRLIPQNLGMKRFSAETVIPDDNAVQKQSDLIDSLESSYQATISTPVSPITAVNKPQERVFEVDIDVLEDKAERNRLNDFFEKSKKRMHGYDNVRVREIFTVNIHDMTELFEKKTNNMVETFHGTSIANTLSILKSGLKINPPSTAAIAGKLYGNGTYGSTCSSKSMGYTFGRWGQGNSGDCGYLFICDFAMGNIFYPKTYKASKPSGYDSIWAKPENTGLNNDELVVYRNSQSKIKYLLECK